MNVIAVYPGRFHPFHKGHAGSYNQLANQFGSDNTYLAISAKQELPKSPFSAGDRAKMAMVLGVPKDKIKAVTNPYAAKEYIDMLEKNGGDAENTALVFGVSKKDMEGVPELNIPPDPRFVFKPKKDGTPSYLQPYTGGELKPMTQHAYVVSTDVEEFPIAGETMRDASAIRKAYIDASEEKELRILQDLYGKHANLIKPIFDRHLPLNESLYNFIRQVKPYLHEATNEQRLRLQQILLSAKSRLSQKHIVENKPTLEAISNTDYLEEK